VQNLNPTYHIDSAPRLRVRRVDEVHHVEVALEKAAQSGKVAFSIGHGGDVANRYGYPAETEGCLAVAFPSGEVEAWVVRVPANKVTLTGVCRKVTGLRGPWHGGDSKEASRRRFVELQAWAESQSPQPA